MTKLGTKVGSYRRRDLESPVEVELDELPSKQTDTLSRAIAESYKNCMLRTNEELLMGEELIAQGRYWHGNE